MKSSFYLFAAVALVMATSCAKTFNVGNDKPVRGDQDEIRFSSYVNVMTKSGTKATETFDIDDGFVVVGGYDYAVIGSSLSAYNTFNATQVYNEGTSESPVWVPKEIPSADLDVAFEQFISQDLFSRDDLNEKVAKCYNSNFKASWLLASMLLDNYGSSAAFDSLKTMSWSPVHKYWNYNTEDAYTFLAFSPASIINDAAMVVPNLFDSNQSGRNSYMDGKLDIMFATTTVEYENFGENVELVFSHLGAKLEFKIKNACSTGISIHSAALGGAISKLAVIGYSMSSSPFLEPTSSDPDPDEPKYHFYIPYITEDMAAAMENDEYWGMEPGYLRNSGFNVYSVPGTIPAGNSMPASFVVCPQSFDPNQNSVMLAYTLGDDPFMYTVQIPLSKFKFNGDQLAQWEAGYKYTYNITIDHDEINFSVSIADWADGGEGTVVVTGE